MPAAEAFVISPPLSAGRVDAIDAAKGIGILLVVFGHVWRGLNTAGIRIDPRLFSAVDDWIYSFHMPLFFFISGLFIARAVKKPAGVFLSDRIALLVYPYVLWSLIQGSMQIALAGKTNTHLDWKSLLAEIAYRPEKTEFWFLYVLTVCTCLYYLLRKVGLNDLAILCVALAIQILKCTHGFAIFGHELGVTYECAMFFPVLALGATAASFVLRWIDRTPQLTLVATTTAGLIGVTYFAASRWQVDETLLGDAHRYVPALCGIAMVLTLASALGNPISRPFKYLGAISLQIYVAHTIAAAAARVGLLKVLHTENFPLHLAAGIVAGVAFPILLVIVTQRLRITGLFVAPWGTSRAARIEQRGSVPESVNSTLTARA